MRTIDKMDWIAKQSIERELSMRGKYTTEKVDPSLIIMPR